MDKVRVTKVSMSKNRVTTGAKVTIQVYAKSITQEPANERLAFVLNRLKPKV